MTRYDHRRIANLKRIGRGIGVGQGFKQKSPDPRLRPSVELAVDGAPLAELLRHGAPWRLCSREPENPLENSAMVAGGRPRNGPVSVTNGSKNAHCTSFMRSSVKSAPCGNPHGRGVCNHCTAHISLENRVRRRDHRDNGDRAFASSSRCIVDVSRSTRKERGLHPSGICARDVVCTSRTSRENGGRVGFI